VPDAALSNTLKTDAETSGGLFKTVAVDEAVGVAVAEPLEELVDVTVEDAVAELVEELTGELEASPDCVTVGEALAERDAVDAGDVLCRALSDPADEPERDGDGDAVDDGDRTCAAPSDLAGEPEGDGEAEVVVDAVREGVEEPETVGLSEDVAEREDAALGLVVTDGDSVALPEAVPPALREGVPEVDADANAGTVIACESAETSLAASARAYTRRSERLPAKGLPPFTVRSPLQPTRSVEEARAGSVMVAACAKTSAPSRKAVSV